MTPEYKALLEMVSPKLKRFTVLNYDETIDQSFGHNDKLTYLKYEIFHSQSQYEITFELSNNATRKYWEYELEYRIDGSLEADYFDIHPEDGISIMHYVLNFIFDVLENYEEVDEIIFTPYSDKNIKHYNFLVKNWTKILDNNLSFRYNIKEIDHHFTIGRQR